MTFFKFLDTGFGRTRMSLKELHTEGLVTDDAVSDSSGKEEEIDLAA